MNKFANTELFNLLIENSPEVSNTKMHKAYENFKEQVRNLNHAENDYSVVFRSLNSTRIEVMALQTFSLCEQWGKMHLKIGIVRKRFGISNPKSTC